MSRLNHIIDIGSLDRVVQIVSIATSYDEFGASIESYTNADHWASVKWLRDKEDVTSGDIRANYRIEVVIRYTAGITTLNQLIHEGRTYDIEGYRELGRRRFIALNCLSYG